MGISRSGFGHSVPTWPVSQDEFRAIHDATQGRAVFSHSDGTWWLHGVHNGPATIALESYRRAWALVRCVRYTS